MSNRLKPLSIIGLLFITFLIILFYVFTDPGENDEGVSASGTVEAVEVVVVIDTGGQVKDVLVEVGDTVQDGDVLVRFSDEILEAQYGHGKAVLNKAKLRYNLVAAQPVKEHRQNDIHTAQIELLNAKLALQDLIDNADLARAHAQQELEDAEEELEDILNPELQQAVELKKSQSLSKLLTRLRNIWQLSVPLRPNLQLNRLMPIC